MATVSSLSSTCLIFTHLMELERKKKDNFDFVNTMTYKICLKKKKTEFIEICWLFDDKRKLSG